MHHSFEISKSELILFLQTQPYLAVVWLCITWTSHACCRTPLFPPSNCINVSAITTLWAQVCKLLYKLLAGLSVLPVLPVPRPQSVSTFVNLNSASCLHQYVESYKCSVVCLPGVSWEGRTVVIISECCEFNCLHYLASSNIIISPRWQH